MEYPSTSNGNAWRHTALLLIIIICLTAPFVQVQAQPNLTFKRLTTNWPDIELYFSVGCNGNPTYNMSKQDFRVFENGVEVKNFTLSCPNPTIPCAISVSLVFDASGSMIGAGNAGAKQAGHAFIDLMDGSIDEAAVLWFTSVPTIQLQMTTDTTMLHAAVDALPANGATAVWDGCYSGLIELINNGANQCRAVILLTDGGDNSSSRQPSELIALANRHHIRVFSVGIGTGIDGVQLDFIAQRTGGKFYQTPNTGQLASIYQEIITILRQGFQECVITYKAVCMDGTMKTVDLQLMDFCGGTDTKIKTYRAPLDSSTYANIVMQLGDVAGASGNDIMIPLDLLTAINDEMVYPFSFTLQYDTSQLQFRHVSLPAGSLLGGVNVTNAPAPGGMLIEVTESKLLNGAGPLLNLTFSTPVQPDTTCFYIRGVDAAFVQGCLRPIVNTGRICIYPKKPNAVCAFTGPTSLVWKRHLKDYDPNPFVVTGRCDNIGDTTLRNARYRIIVDTNAVRLISPATSTQAPTPADIKAGIFAEVTWQLAAKKRTSGDSVDICIQSSFDNYPDVTSCLKVSIPRTGPMLECDIDVPGITADTANLRYSPMPFPLTVTALSTGGTITDTVFASIILPPEITLAAPDIPTQYTKKLLPPVLNPTQSGSLTWMLSHAPVETERTYTITVWTYATNTDSSKCEVQLRIPGLPPLGFDTQLTADGPRAFCEGDSVILDAASGYASYHWLGGELTQRITVKHAGEYSCVVRRTDGVYGRSDTVRVMVFQLPEPVITPGNPVTICKGEAVTLRTTEGYAEYEWSTGATTPDINVPAAGRYHVRVRTADNCWGNSDTVTVSMKPSPAKPVIRRLGDAIRTDTAHQHQWYRNNAPLPGANGPLLALTQTGVYQVRVTNAEGCSAMSDPFNVSVLNVDDVPPLAENASLNVYPEPAVDMLRIGLTGAANQTVTLALYDVLGRAEVIHTGVLPDGGAVFTHSLRNRTPGVYYLVALHSESVLVKRVTKM